MNRSILGLDYPESSIPENLADAAVIKTGIFRGPKQHDRSAAVKAVRERRPEMASAQLGFSALVKRCVETLATRSTMPRDVAKPPSELVKDAPPHGGTDIVAKAPGTMQRLFRSVRRCAYAQCRVLPELIRIYLGLYTAKIYSFIGLVRILTQQRTAAQSVSTRPVKNDVTPRNLAG